MMIQTNSDPPLGDASDVPALSRVTYFDGERLAANDLNDAATVQRELRWLHNRSLHNWGIGIGFGVSGNKGDRQVLVAPGYAIDRMGREIILTGTLAKAVPAKSAKTICYLVASYPDDAALTVTERRAGECGSDGAVRLQEQADIHWRIQGEQTVASGREIVLAQATIENCQLAAPLSLDQRRNARTSQQPYIAAGETPQGNTQWELWTVTNQAAATPTPTPTGTPAPPIILGVKTTVDTAPAHFGTIPEYQAQLRGPRFIDLTNSSGSVGLVGHAAAGSRMFILDGTGVVDAADRNSFDFYVLMPRSFGSSINNPAFFTSDAGSTFLLNLLKLNWTVVWIGVEG
jgi:hypothetical protein